MAAKQDTLKKIKSLINMCSLMGNPNFKKLQNIGNIGIYGSFAENNINMWLYTEKNNQKIQEIARELEKDMKKKLNLLILNKKKIENLKKNDYEFYTRLKLTSIQFGNDIFK